MVKGHQVAPDYAEYRRQSLMCQECAEKAVTPQLRADWLNLASRWLRMIPLEYRNASEWGAAERFEEAMTASDTGQANSPASH
jgi:hypothetical protein